MINKEYFDENAMQVTHKLFSAERSVQLKNILNQKDYLSLLESAKRSYTNHIIEPLLYSYRSTSFTNKKVIRSIQEITEKVTQKSLSLQHATLFRFQHRDYTLLYDDMKEDIGVLAILELTPHWKEEFGGATFFMKKSEEFLRVIPSQNTLTIAEMTKDLRKFVKYINHTATNRKRYVIELLFAIKK